MCRNDIRALPPFRPYYARHAAGPTLDDRLSTMIFDDDISLAGFCRLQMRPTAPGGRRMAPDAMKQRSF